MRFYVEGSVGGPESFAKKDEALKWAEAMANRFGVITEVFDSTTHEPLRGNGHYGSRTGAPFATFRPAPVPPAVWEAEEVGPDGDPADHDGAYFLFVGPDAQKRATALQTAAAERGVRVDVRQHGATINPTTEAAIKLLWSLN